VQEILLIFILPVNKSSDLLRRGLSEVRVKFGDVSRQVEDLNLIHFHQLF
jgi:hypothetical protein